MMEIQEFLIDALQKADKARDRSNQVEIGPSQIGDCRPKVWLQLQGKEGTNKTLKLPALMGTAIHHEIERAIHRLDAFGEKFMLETEVEYNGLKGHVDLFIPESGALVDWKTTKTKNLAYFPNQQQRWQVHLYGLLLTKNGHTVKTVSLFGIPRDGDERHIKVHTEEWSEEIAEQALAWLEDVKSRDEQPAPERDAVSFCQHYCEYFGDLCSGKEKAAAASSVIEDEIAVKAASRYLEINRLVKALEDEQAGLKTALEGVSGVSPEGVTVTWSEMAGRSTVDEAEVEKLLGYVPKKVGNPSTRLSVK
jgi:Domain of unknown function DUF83